MIVKFEAQHTINITRNFQRAFFQNDHSVSAQRREYHPHLQNDILACSRLPIFFTFCFGITVVIRRHQHDTESCFPVDLLFQRFNDCLALTIIVLKNIWVQIQATQHKFELLKCRVVMPVDHKYFSSLIG